ncbi:unnamed protein product [Linum trigynum]|uniref:FAR1 domain-containing protein n=1 Tax=Linum trigynum TaxID=586398 RepID=A0AAV2GDV7_9ROSI
MASEAVPPLTSEPVLLLMSEPIQENDGAGASHTTQEDNVVDLISLQPKDIKKMKFDNTEEAYDFYMDYGLVKGFDIRKSDIGHDKNQVMIWRDYVCSGEGKRRMKSTERKREARGGDQI